MLLLLGLMSSNDVRRPGSSGRGSTRNARRRRRSSSRRVRCAPPLSPNVQRTDTVVFRIAASFASRSGRPSRLFTSRSNQATTSSSTLSRPPSATPTSRAARAAGQPSSRTSATPLRPATRMTLLPRWALGSPPSQLITRTDDFGARRMATACARPRTAVRRTFSSASCVGDPCAFFCSKP